VKKKEGVTGSFKSNFFGFGNHRYSNNNVGFRVGFTDVVGEFSKLRSPGTAVIENDKVGGLRNLEVIGGDGMGINETAITFGIGIDEGKNGIDNSLFGDLAGE